MRETILSATVPGTPIVITVSKLPADASLAAVLRDKPGTGRWVDSFEAKCESNGLDIVGPSTSSVGRKTEAEAREAANAMWAYAVSQRDAALRKA